MIGNHAAALQAIEESLRIKQHNLGPQHPDVAADLLEMAQILLELVCRVGIWGQVGKALAKRAKRWQLRRVEREPRN